MDGLVEKFLMVRRDKVEWERYKVQHDKKLLSDSGAANVAAPVFYKIAVGYTDVDRTGEPCPL